jgi:hypothetical protein
MLTKERLPSLAEPRQVPVLGPALPRGRAHRRIALFARKPETVTKHYFIGHGQQLARIRAKNQAAWAEGYYAGVPIDKTVNGASRQVLRQILRKAKAYQAKKAA